MARLTRSVTAGLDKWPYYDRIRLIACPIIFSMKKQELFFSTLLIPLDYLLLLLAGISAYHLRFSQWTTEVRPVIFSLPFDDYFRSLALVSAIIILIFIASGLYRIKARKLALELSHILFACTAGLALLAIIIFFQRDLFDSRFIVLAGFLLAIAYISLGHIFVRWLQKRLYSYGIGVGRLLLVGGGKTADNFIAEFSSHKKYGWEVARRIRDFSLDTAQEMEEYLQSNQIDGIIQCDPNLSKAEFLRLFDFANDHHINFRYVADLLEVKVLRNETSEILGVPVVEVKRTTLEGWGRVTKRIVDIVFSSLLIILFSPVFLATAVLIKLDSKGPVFFFRKDDGAPLLRIGEGGKPFRYFKFRSMIPNSDSMRYRELADKNLRGDGPLVKIKDDPRVTRVGKVIRRLSIDELPELFLVFIGRMSLVGPRPHLPEEVAKYENHQRKTLTVKPGITGLAQVSGRSDLLFEEEVKLDVYYLENWSLLLDFSILLRTPLAVLKHRGTE